MSSKKEKGQRTAQSSDTAAGSGNSAERPDTQQTEEPLESFFQAAVFEIPHDLKNRRKRPDERGLPSDSALRELAKTYLEAQRWLWPEKVKSGQLPDSNDETIARMGADFKRRFLAIDSA